MVETPEQKIPFPKLDKGSIPIILWNLTPILGAIFLHWKPESVFICYALETIVIGIFNVFRLTAVYYYGLPPAPDETGVTGLGIIPFFIFHYFFFVFVQLSLFFPLSGNDGFGPLGAIKHTIKFAADKTTNIALAAYVVNCGFAFVNDFILT